MSLRVWLPLTGDLRNQGISDYTPTLVSDNTWATSGKIGNKSLTLIKLQTILPTSSCMTGAKEISYCYWVKVNTAWSANWLDGIRWIETNGSTTATARQEFYTNCTLIGTWYKGGSISGKGFTPGEWTHLAATFNYNTGEVKFYINGTLRGSTSNLDTTYYCRGDFYIGDNGTNICENDVRIYDHCLSAAEVKEISQGLVLHYKLDDPYSISTTNLLGTKSENFVNVWGSYGFGGHGQITEANIPPALSGHAALVTNKDSGNYSGEIATSAGNTIMNKNDTLTFSAYVKGNGNTIGKTGRIHLYNTNGTNTLSTGANFTFTDQWQRVSYTLTWTYDTPSNASANCYVHCTRAQGESFYISNCQLERGNIATGFTNSSRETNVIEDSSGYNHNGSTLNTVNLSNDSPRYTYSTKLEAANSMINCGRGGMVTDSITVNIWFKASGWGNPVSCTEGGGWNFEASGDYFRFPIYISGVGYKYGQSTHTRAQLCNNQWHMLTGMYDRINGRVRIYVDGELDNDFDAQTHNNIAYHPSNCIWIGAEATGSNTTASNGMAGLFSDFRIYCTPLLDIDIKQLYNVSMKIDNQYNVHTFEMVEHNVNKINKNGQVQFSAIYENGLMEKLHYDKTIYTEPDGSTWVRVFHHNDPTTSGLFVKTSDWEHGVYESADKWYDIEQIVPLLIKYEFMVKQKTTSSANEVKYRWVQTADPLTCVYSDVSPGHVAINTSTGYTNSSYGGLWKMNSSARMCIANASSGNWYGAMGSWTVYNTNNVPGYPNSNISTGYLDFYVRVYPNVKDIKNYGLTANQFIER